MVALSTKPQLLVWQDCKVLGRQRRDKKGQEALASPNSSDVTNSLTSPLCCVPISLWWSVGSNLKRFLAAYVPKTGGALWVNRVNGHCWPQIVEIVVDQVSVDGLLPPSVQLPQSCPREEPVPREALAGRNSTRDVCDAQTMKIPRILLRPSQEKIKQKTYYATLEGDLKKATTIEYSLHVFQVTTDDRSFKTQQDVDTLTRLVLCTTPECLV